MDKGKYFLHTNGINEGNFLHSYDIGIEETTLFSILVGLVGNTI